MKIPKRPFALLGLMLLALTAGCGEWPLEGGLQFRDSNSGAKAGLVFQGRAKPRASLRMPITDPDGNVIGMADLRGGPVVEASK